MQQVIPLVSSVFAAYVSPKWIRIVHYKGEKTETAEK